MINMFPDSALIPRAKQKLRDVQEVLAERETGIGLYYGSRENFVASIARLRTVVDTYPLYSKSDQALLAIGDAYAGEARAVRVAPNLPGAVRERLVTIYNDRAAEAYSKVITRYPMAPHVEDARDRLVAMNRTVPEPTQAAVAESDAEERSRQALHFTDKTLGLIKRGPTVVEAVHVGDPSLQDPKRTLAPDVSTENRQIFTAAINNGKPVTADVPTPTGPNEPPRTDQPSNAPLQLSAPAGGTGVGAEIVSAPASDPNALVKSVQPTNSVLPAPDKPAEAPLQTNEIKPGTTPTAPTVAQGTKAKKPKADLSEESSSKKKKKEGIGKLNPF